MHLKNSQGISNLGREAASLHRPLKNHLKILRDRDSRPNMKRRQRKFGELTKNLKEPYRMALIKRGEVFLVNFDPTIGAEAKKTRPAVVVSNDINNAHSPIISIAPITSNVTKVYSFEVEIPTGTAGLRTRSKVMVNQTRAVDKIRLINRLGQLPLQIMKD